MNLSRNHFALRHALWLLAAVVALRASTLVVPIFIHDEACIAVQAQTLLRGGHLYTDTVDRKPPGVPYLYAAVFAVRGHADMIAVHVLAIIVVWLTALVMWSEAGLLAAWLYLLTNTSFLPIDVMGANFELFMLLPATMAMWVARRRDLASIASAGALVALAGLCKQTALVMLLPVAFRVREEGAAGIAALTLGFTTTILVAVRMFGAHDLYFWTVSGNGGYLAVDGVLHYIVPRLIGMTAAFAAATLPLWWLVARAWPMSTRDTDWWVWLGASAIAVTGGFRFFGHYYLHLLPPAAALGASVLPRLSPRTRERVLGSMTLVAFGFAALGFWGRELHRMPSYDRLAHEIQQRTKYDEPIAIWGNYPELLWAADRRSSVRFVHSNFVTGFSSGRPTGRDTERFATIGARQMMFEDLAAHPPALFIDTAPANLRDYGSYPLADFPLLDAYVHEHFHPVAVEDGIVIYERTQTF